MAASGMQSNVVGESRRHHHHQGGPVREKPPLPPENKRPLSPGPVRRTSKTSLPLLRSLSPEPVASGGGGGSSSVVAATSRCAAAGGAARPCSPTPEREIAKILSFEIPPKRNSVVHNPCLPDLDDSKTFRPISPSPITAADGSGVREEQRPMSPPPARPFSPLPGWLDAQGEDEEEDDGDEEDLSVATSVSSPPPPPPPQPSMCFSPPPSAYSAANCCQSPPPSAANNGYSPVPGPLSPQPLLPPSEENDQPSPLPPFRCTSQPSANHITLRIIPRDRRRPVSAPGVPASQKSTAAGGGSGVTTQRMDGSRPLSPVFKMPRPKSGFDSSRFVVYRNFKATDERHKEFLRPKEKPRPPQVLVEPKWQVKSNNNVMAESMEDINFILALLFYGCY